MLFTIKNIYCLSHCLFVDFSTTVTMIASILANVVLQFVALSDQIFKETLKIRVLSKY